MFVATIVMLALGVLPLFYKLWPGCLVSIIVLLGGLLPMGLLSNDFEKEKGSKGNFELYMKISFYFIILWTVLFYIAGLICLFSEDCKWWIWAIIVCLSVCAEGGIFAIISMMLDIE
jgi:hypothetical protein